MKERACEFGPELNLIGILTEPKPADARSDVPAMVMLNAGLLHRVGPHRMSVILSRRLADRGFHSLRFDLGGRGDSTSTRTAQSDESQVLTDIIPAMDYVEQKCGIHKFVLFGLCAGADNAHLAALRDPRVAGIVLLDGYGYWTRRSYFVHYFPRIWRPRAWFNYFRRSFAAPAAREDDFGVHGQRRPFGARLDVESEIQTLLDRNTQLLYIYTGGVFSYYNYAGQFFDMFPHLNANDKIEVELYSNADHTYTLEEDREILLKRVVEWYSSRNWG